MTFREGAEALFTDMPDPDEFPAQADEKELARRDEEMDSGVVVPLSHEEFIQQVGLNPPPNEGGGHRLRSS